MGIIKNFIIKRIIKQIKSNKIFQLPDYICQDDLYYKDNDGITFFEHILTSESAYKYVFSMLDIPEKDPNIVFLLAKYKRLNKNTSLCLKLSDDDLFFKYNDKILLDYIFEEIDAKQFDDLLFKITRKPEIIDYLIQKQLLFKICKLNPELADKINIEKYVKNNYIFIELMKLFKDKKRAYEICEKYNKSELLNLIFENDFVEIIKKNKSVIDFKHSFLKEDQAFILEKEDQILINKFISLFEKELDKEKLVFLYNCFCKSLVSGNNAIRELLTILINIKILYPNSFKYTFNPKTISYYKNGQINLASEQMFPVVLFHETGHLLHHYIAQKGVPDSILNKIIYIRSNPKVISKGFDKFKKLYQKIISKEYKRAKEYSSKYFSCVNRDYESYLKQLDLPDEIISEIQCISNFKEKILKKQDQIICEEYVNKCFYKKYPQIYQISDILDAILAGNVKSIYKMFGHDEKYFSNINNCFCEIVACFIAISCLPSKADYLEILKSIIGDDLFYDIEKYCNNLLSSQNKIDEQKRK